MLSRHCYPIALWAAVAVLSPVLAPASAFDDREFCLAAQQLSIAAGTDVGLWIDRITRNAVMSNHSVSGLSQILISSLRLRDKQKSVD
jgi:hypothetical protein